MSNTPEDKLIAIAKATDNAVRYYRGVHPFVVYETKSGWALKGVVGSILVSLLPTATASEVSNKFAKLIDTRGE